MRILVTGGAGFIASHVADEYIKLGHKVTIVDNLLTGKKNNLNPRAKFYKTDIRDQKSLRHIMRRERPEIINHHAAIAEVAKSLRDPIPSMEVNVQGTINLLLLGSEARIKKFIFASSGGTIYGEPKKIPVTELAPETPVSPYGLSKLFAEKAIHFYARQHNFNYLIFRYPNVYGPRQNPKGEAGVVAIFTGLMKKGVRPIIFGDGSKTRDYIYVKDIVRANGLALRRGTKETLNIGSGRQITDYDIFHALSGRLDFKAKPIYAPYRKGEVYKMALSAKKAKRVIGFTPTISFEAGLDDYLKSLN